MSWKLKSCGFGIKEKKIGIPKMALFLKEQGEIKQLDEDINYSMPPNLSTELVKLEIARIESHLATDGEKETLDKSYRRVFGEVQKDDLGSSPRITTRYALVLTRIGKNFSNGAPECYTSIPTTKEQPLIRTAIGTR
jgi:hypothetical protein